LVTVASKDPGWVASLASLVTSNGLETLLVWIGAKDAFNLLLLVLDVLA